MNQTARDISERSMLECMMLIRTCPDAPAPSSYVLEQAFVPQAEAIVAAAARLMQRAAA